MLRPSALNLNHHVSLRSPPLSSLPPPHLNKTNKSVGLLRGRGYNGVGVGGVGCFLVTTAGILIDGQSELESKTLEIALFSRQHVSSLHYSQLRKVVAHFKHFVKDSNCRTQPLKRVAVLYSSLIYLDGLFMFLVRIDPVY